ncbi:hypothetical protein [Clostridium sp. D43t1_170807_H7]|uniref:hypothetical protein n=1 Tax=Clostridium sp. D43t1_170807_H7 TaxID=2787140 RepID=UPI00189BF43E|nr:hypothetical protein [Clostridium sp. D43t1_170807_H7]MEE0932571.1 hypothetical protein [Clostridium sp.]
MSLISTYEKFTHINEEFIEFIDKLVGNNFKSFTDDQIKMNLNIALKNYEKLKFESDEIQVEEANKNNLNDLRYLIMSALFLVSDLIHFYNLKEYERFKMRAVNYINNSRRGKIIY